MGEIFSGEGGLRGALQLLEMEELLRLIHLPAEVGWPMALLVLAFGLVQLGHAVIRLLEAWDRYRANRPGATRPPG